MNIALWIIQVLLALLFLFAAAGPVSAIRMVPFYQSQGWQLVEQPVLIEQPSREIASPLRVMVLPFGGQSWPDGKIKLNSFPW